MHSDAFFTRGKTHLVCQDYARAGVISPGFLGEGGRAFAIVSDGCSSSPDTDFGSRLVTMSAVRSIEINGDNLPLKVEHIIWGAGDCLPRNLPQQSLDATLIAAYVRDDGNVQVISCGDGVIAARRVDTGDIEVIDIDCQNTPNYLSYMLEPKRLLSYREGIKNIDDVYQGRYLHRWASLKSLREGDSPDNSLECPISIEGDLGKTVTYDNFPFSTVISPKEYDLVMVFSDGVQSFQSNTYEPVPMGLVLEQLVKIKSFTGKFIARRCKSFLNKFCKKEGWNHYDDLSVAAIYLR